LTSKVLCCLMTDFPGWRLFYGASGPPPKNMLSVA